MLRRILSEALYRTVIHMRLHFRHEIQPCFIREQDAPNMPQHSITRKGISSPHSCLNHAGLSTLADASKTAACMVPSCAVPASAERLMRCDDRACGLSSNRLKGVGT